MAQPSGLITFSRLGYEGQLGNQMFQYAMLKGVAAKTGLIPKIPDRYSGFDKKNGLVELEPFTIDCDKLQPQDLDHIQEHYWANRFKSFDEAVFRVGPNTDFLGWFQSHKYFEHIEDQIRTEFRFKQPFQKKINQRTAALCGKVGNRPIVSLHVRRGDYLDSPRFQASIAQPAYYQSAIQHFKDQMDPVFLCFSDDLAWCKNNLTDAEFIFLDEPDPHLTLGIVSQCDHHICASSSFSWWAAWLNRSSKKIVIAPDPYDEDRDPSDWIHLNSQTGQRPAKTAGSISTLRTDTERKNILFTWELGNGIDQLATLKPIFRKCIVRGHNVFVAAQNVSLAHLELKQLPIHLLQAPLPPISTLPSDSSIHSYIQLFGEIFGNASRIAPKIRAWKELFEGLEPDVVVFNHSPMALLAARSFEFGRVHIGTDLSCPPRQFPMPVFSKKMNTDQALRGELAVLQQINQILDASNLCPLTRLCDLFLDVDATVITATPETDRFGRRPNVRHCGSSIDGDEAEHLVDRIEAISSTARVSPSIKSPTHSIPKILHRIWLGDAPVPAEYQQYADNWQRHHPDWEMRLWTDDNLPDLMFADAFASAGNFTIQSDLLRFEILYRHGGVYVDTDMDCLKNIEPLLTDAGFMCIEEQPDQLVIALLASYPSHPILRTTIEQISDLLRDNPHLYESDDMKTVLTTQKAFNQVVRRQVSGGVRHVLDEDRVLEVAPNPHKSVVRCKPHCFCPYLWDEDVNWQSGKSATEQFPNSYGVHHWGATWHTA